MNKALLQEALDALAQEIRRVNGNNSMGAGALAESIIKFYATSQTAPKQASPVQAIDVTDADVELAYKMTTAFSGRDTYRKVLEAFAASKASQTVEIATPVAQPVQPAAVGAVEQDAMRYRRLREQHEGDAEACCVFAPNDMHECLVPVGCLPGELDAFIDADIAAKEVTR